MSLDLPGATLGTAGITLVTIGLVWAADTGTVSARAALPALAGLALLGCFAVVEARAVDPLLPLQFLADRRRVLALGSLALAAAATSVASLFVSLHVQQTQEWTPLRTSVGFVPYAATLVIAGGFAGRLIGRLGPMAVLSAGLAASSAGMGLLTSIGPGSSYTTALLPGLVALPLGMALVFAAGAVLTVADVPPSRLGLASGAMNTAIEIGPAIGLAAASAVAAARTAALGPAPGDAASGYATAFAAFSLCLGLAAILAAASRRTSHRVGH